MAWRISVSSAAIGIAGFAISYATSVLGAPRWTGWLALGIALAACVVFLSSILRWRCIKFTASRCTYQWDELWSRLRGRGAVRVLASMEAVVIPGSATSSRDLRFTTTKEAKRFISTGEANPPPVGVRFQSPIEQNVTHVPTDVRHCGRLIFRMEEFNQAGIVIGNQLPGIDVCAAISYHQRAARPDVGFPLLIEVEESEWRDFRHLALVLEAKVKLTNQTERSIRIRSFGLSTDQRSPQWSVSGNDWRAVEQEVAQAEERRQSLNRHRELEPGATESGWIVHAFGRPESGTPGYAIVIRDVTGNDYRKDIPAQEAQEFAS